MARVHSQGAQQGELGRGQGHSAAAYLDPMGIQVDQQLLDADHLRQSGLSLYAAQDPSHAGHNLPGVEGLGDIVAGAQLQPHDLVTIFDAGREHDEGHGSQPRVRPLSTSRLFVAQRVDRVEAGGPVGRIEAKEDADAQ